MNMFINTKFLKTNIYELGFPWLSIRDMFILAIGLGFNINTYDTQYLFM